MKCNKKDCVENRNGQCAIGLHPSWATCPENNTEKSVTLVEGTPFERHKQLYQAFLDLGCCDGEREEN